MIVRARIERTSSKPHSRVHETVHHRTVPCCSLKEHQRRDQGGQNARDVAARTVGMRAILKSQAGFGDRTFVTVRPRDSANDSGTTSSTVVARHASSTIFVLFVNQ
jgi:hypothetical protein